MNKLSLVLVLLAGPAFAQEANLTAPVVRPSEAKHTIKGFYAEAPVAPGAGYAYFNMEVRAANDVVIRSYKIELPDTTHPAATVAAMFTAINTVIPGERGAVQQRTNARLIDFLVRNTLIPPATVAP